MGPMRMWVAEVWVVGQVAMVVGLGLNLLGALLVVL
jgi:hypothetical protein